VLSIDHHLRSNSLLTISPPFFSSIGYFLAGRQAAWWAIGPSLISVNIGAEQFLGLAASGATMGMGVGHFEWLSPFFLILSAWIFVPFYRRAEVGIFDFLRIREE
jgi:uncharacterized sodium:solute symporter family permease YidK